MTRSKFMGMKDNNKTEQRFCPLYNNIVDEPITKTSGLWEKQHPLLVRNGKIKINFEYQTIYRYTKIIK